MIKLGKKKNVYMGIASIGAGLRENLPCPQALSLLKEGVEKLLWGSDIPGTLKSIYLQSNGGHDRLCRLFK